MPTFTIPIVPNEESGRPFSKVKEITFSKPRLVKLHEAARGIDRANNHSLLDFGYQLLRTVNVADTHSLEGCGCWLCRFPW